MPSEAEIEAALNAQPQNSPVRYFLNPNGYLSDEAVHELMGAALSAASAVRSEPVAYVPQTVLDGLKEGNERLNCWLSAKPRGNWTTLYSSPVQTREDGLREALQIARAVRKRMVAGRKRALPQVEEYGASIADGVAAAIEAILSQPEPKGDKA